MEPNVYDKIKEVDLKNTMESSYIDYAMSVIVSRALPDVRDGLKPVQRRILYAAMKMGATYDKKTKKCATIVGETMGHYHPHGDSSIYGSLVNMGQPWSMRYTLIDKQGNFGSEDGDSPAASRYTEGKLSRLAMEMLEGINKDTVDFVPNFSNEQGYDEPTVLPAQLPNILINGTTGIAVGMTTNMPPHNLREVIGAACMMIDRKIAGEETSIDDIMGIIKGPDFPTGGEIMGTRGIEECYRTGRGKIRMRAVCDIETMAGGKNAIIVRELPYLVYRSRVIENIADLHKEKKIDGITGIYDTVGKDSDSKIRIELRKDVNPQVVLNQLYKHTQLQDTFGAIMLCIVRGEPKVLNIKQLLEEYILHQESVVTRRTAYDLKKAEDRDHILQGLLIALDHIDEIIKIIRGADDAEDARNQLMEAFGFTQVQAQAIVDMRLRALTGLERHKVEEEHRELLAKIAYFREILSDKNKLLGLIREEISEIADKYGDDRRTKISFESSEMNMEDLISDDDVVITRTSLGYIKRMDVGNFKAQNRGGKGIKGSTTIENDYVEDILRTSNHKYIMFFTNLGKVYRLKAYEIPEASRTARGTAVVNLLQLEPGEKITAIIPIREYLEDRYIVMATAKGLVKKTSLMDYANVRKNGLIAISLRDGDELIEVKFTDGQEEIILVSARGMAIRFHESDVRPTGRNSMGVTGMRFSDPEDHVIAMQILNQGSKLLLVTEKGMGKRTETDRFRIQSRGGKGIIAYKLTDKTGELIAAKLCDDNTDILMITTQGQMIRTPVEGISVIGRNASGVRVMNIDSEGGEYIAGIAKVSREESDDADETGEDGDILTDLELETGAPGEEAEASEEDGAGDEDEPDEDADEDAEEEPEDDPEDDDE